MTAKDIVKEIMALRKWSQSQLAEEAGFKRQSNITGILNRGTSLRVDNFIKMIEAMGCELIVKDKMGSNHTWKVTLEEKKQSDL